MHLSSIAKKGVFFSAHMATLTYACESFGPLKMHAKPFCRERAGKGVLFSVEEAVKVACIVGDRRQEAGSAYHFLIAKRT
ncbi:hypothetical protein ACH95_14990 [Bacillus glycinifermentans]|nr:hypothetical protein ACH95_14990 [Bacillus glycinifermentans]